MRRAGFSAVYTLVLLTGMVAVTGLAVDWGRVVTVEAELSAAADAAALHGIRGLRDGTWAARAVALANQHRADNAPLAITAADVESGTWNNATAAFSAGGANRTAVRVTVRRTVSLTFLPLLGVDAQQQLTVRAVAKGGAMPYGLIGLDSVSITGNGSATASYSSLGPAATDQGHVASNGNITLGGSAMVDGKAMAGPGRATTGGTVTGGRGNLASPLSYPNGDAGVYATSNDNGSVPAWAWAYPGAGSGSIALGSGQVLTLPGGTYYLNNVTLGGGSELRFAGRATVYCYGTLGMTGNTYTAANVPQNLRLVMCPKPDGSPPGAVTVSSTAALYAAIYAPQSAVSVSGNGAIHGSVLGRSVAISGTADVYFDLALDQSDGLLSLVR